MTCTAAQVPKPPTILHLQARQSSANFSLSAFSGPGTHSDTRLLFGSVSPFVELVDTTLGIPSLNATLQGLSLVQGRTYWLRASVENEVGFSFLSKNSYSVVPAEFSFPPVDVVLEPVPASVTAIPINPDFVAQPTEHRESVEWVTQTQDTIRRLIHPRARMASVMVWENLTITQRNTVRDFLQTRIDAVEGWGTDDPAHGTRTWFTRRGTIDTREVAPGVWSVQIDADEIFIKRFWTVGVSLVGGADTIR